MRTERTNLTTINELLDIITQHTAFEPFTVEVHVGPGLMYYLLPQLLNNLRNICPPGTKVDIDSIGQSFTHHGHKFVVNNDLANGFSIRINGGLVTDYRNG